MNRDNKSSAQIDQLQNEQLRGNNAKHAYENFIKSFCEEKRIVLFDGFRQLNLTDEIAMMEIKRMLTAVDTLETEIMTIIETGKLASISLNEKEVKH